MSLIIRSACFCSKLMSYKVIGPSLAAGTEWYRWARFKRADYLGGTEDLGSSVKAKIVELAGKPAKDIEGDVFCLVHLRYLGFYFSPLNVYFLKQQDRFRYMLAEVSNTPWHEKHYYLVDLLISSRTPKISCVAVQPNAAKLSLIIPPDAIIARCTSVCRTRTNSKKVLDATLASKARNKPKQFKPRTCQTPAKRCICAGNLLGGIALICQANAALQTSQERRC